METVAIPTSGQPTKEMELGLVPIQVLENAWHQAAPLLQKALARAADGLTLEDVYAHLCLGEMQLWATWEKGKVDCLAYMVTQFLKDHGQYTLLIRLFAGLNRELWLHFLPLVEDWALMEGATKIEVWGRAGWERVLAPHNFKKKLVVLSKELRPKRMDS
ncbi:MAG: hypothetical protein FVQ79_00050 [Planctomycetes bacterium]|nr:hypothetical protein [Planctomycetota bacterium]